MPRQSTAKKQAGVVLLVALIVLTGMMIGGAALTRSVDTANLIAGNLAFRQGARQAADIGIETAVDWIESKSSGTGLYQNDVASGYLARRQDPVPGQSWDDFWKTTLLPAGAIFNLPVDSQGNTVPFNLEDGVFRPRVSYVIQRLCNAAGDPNTADCAVSPANESTGNSKGGSKGFQARRRIYYRITCRVAGPKNVVSYVQTIVLI